MKSLIFTFAVFCRAVVLHCLFLPCILNKACKKRRSNILLKLKEMCILFTSTLAVFILCTGCSTRIYLSHYASPEEDSAAKHLTVPSGKSLIYVLQGFHLRTDSYQTIVLVDDRALRVLEPRTYCFEVIDPGQHKLGIRSVNRFFTNRGMSYYDKPMSGFIGKEAVFDLKPDQVYFFEGLIHTVKHQYIFSQEELTIIDLKKLKEGPGRNLLEGFRLSEQLPAQ